MPWGLITSPSPRPSTTFARDRRQAGRVQGVFRRLLLHVLLRLEALDRARNLLDPGRRRSNPPGCPATPVSVGRPGPDVLGPALRGPRRRPPRGRPPSWGRRRRGSTSPGRSRPSARPAAARFVPALLASISPANCSAARPSGPKSSFDASGRPPRARSRRRRRSWPCRPTPAAASPPRRTNAANWSRSSNMYTTALRRKRVRFVVIAEARFRLVVLLFQHRPQVLEAFLPVLGGVDQQMSGLQGGKIARARRGPGGLRGLLAIRRLVRRVVRPTGRAPERQNRRGRADAALHETSPFRVTRLRYQPPIIPDGRAAAPNFPLGGAARYRDSMAGPRRTRRAFNRRNLDMKRDDSPSAWHCPRRAVRRAGADRRPRRAAPLTSDSVVKATAVADKPGPDGKQTVTLTLAIDKGWHLYANPVGTDDLAPVQTVVRSRRRALWTTSKSTTQPARRSRTPPSATTASTRTRRHHRQREPGQGRRQPAGADRENPGVQTTRNCRLPSELKLTAAP